MTQFRFKKIFIGGYTKSGTTFVGRCFDILNGVYTKGEEDYFRLVFGGLNQLVNKFNTNINIVNREVYDGQGSIAPVNQQSQRLLQQKVFFHLFFSGEDVPKDCLVIVEKSPHNIFRLKEIQSVFPAATNICVYRPGEPVFRSLMRHMADHRNEAYHDPASSLRKGMLEGFCNKWSVYVDLIEKNRGLLKVVRYQSVVDDTETFLEFIQDRILGNRPGFSTGVETLSKEHYLANLPAEVREKSLVQAGPSKIVLTEDELSMLALRCRNPGITFDF